MIVERPLTPTQAAFIRLVEDEHVRAVAVADAVRAQRSQVMLDELHVPHGVGGATKIVGGVLCLVYDDGALDAPTGPAAIPEVGTEKSTGADAPEGA